MTNQFLTVARDKVFQDQFELSQHTQKEAAEEQISVDDIEHAILTGQELEPSPNDPRDPSCLMVGQDDNSRWVHVVCGNFDWENLLIITVYLPKLPKWQDSRTRAVKL